VPPPDVLRGALVGVEQSVAVTLTSRVGEVDGLVTFDADDAFRSADLAWIHTVQAGVDTFDLAALGERGAVLTNSAGIHGDTVGETVAGYMLSFARPLPGIGTPSARKRGAGYRGTHPSPSQASGSASLDSAR